MVTIPLIEMVKTGGWFILVLADVVQYGPGEFASF